MHPFLASLLFLGVCAPLPAQWLKIKTPGLPRKADGKADLTAPVPKTPDGKPDLSGLWYTDENTYGVDITVDLKAGEVRPWAQEIYKQRLDALDRDTPATRCLPGGPVEIIGSAFRMIQAPNITAILYGGGSYRQIFTDGRELPKDPNPTWWGYSIGHWDGNALVVESAGFNDRSWLDFSGHPHTEDLRVTERFERRDFGHMQIQVTFDDPKTFTRPLHLTIEAVFNPDTEMLEYVCNENEKDTAHLVGVASDEVKGPVKLSPQVLARYAGNYRDATSKLDATIRVAGDQLMFSLGGQGALPLANISETSFMVPGGFPVDFVKDEKGNVTNFLFHAPGPDLNFVRVAGQPRP